MEYMEAWLTAQIKHLKSAVAALEAGGVGGAGSPMVFSSTSEPSTNPGVSAAIHYRHNGSGTLVGQWWWDNNATSWRLFMGAGTATITV